MLKKVPPYTCIHARRGGSREKLTISAGKISRSTLSGGNRSGNKSSFTGSSSSSSDAYWGSVKRTLEPLNRCVAVRDDAATWTACEGTGIKDSGFMDALLRRLPHYEAK